MKENQTLCKDSTFLPIDNTCEEVHLTKEQIEQMAAEKIHKYICENYLISGKNKAELELWLKSEFKANV